MIYKQESIQYRGFLAVKSDQARSDEHASLRVSRGVTKRSSKLGTTEQSLPNIAICFDQNGDIKRSMTKETDEAVYVGLTSETFFVKIPAQFKELEPSDVFLDCNQIRAESRQEGAEIINIQVDALHLPTLSPDLAEKICVAGLALVVIRAGHQLRSTWIIFTTGIAMPSNLEGFLVSATHGLCLPSKDKRIEHFRSTRGLKTRGNCFLWLHNQILPEVSLVQGFSETGGELFFANAPLLTRSVVKKMYSMSDRTASITNYVMFNPWSKKFTPSIKPIPTALSKMMYPASSSIPSTSKADTIKEHVAQQADKLVKARRLLETSKRQNAEVDAAGVSRRDEAKKTENSFQEKLQEANKALSESKARSLCITIEKERRQHSKSVKKHPRILAGFRNGADDEIPALLDTSITAAEKTKGYFPPRRKEKEAHLEWSNFELRAVETCQKYLRNISPELDCSIPRIMEGTKIDRHLSHKRRQCKEIVQMVESDVSENPDNRAKSDENVLDTASNIQVMLWNGKLKHSLIEKI